MFQQFFSLVICTANGAGFDRWLRAFARLVPGFSVTTGAGIGGWVGAEGLVVEPNAVFVTWQPGWVAVKRLIRLARALQSIERQEAIGLTWVGADGWAAAAPCTPDDWTAVTELIRLAFDAAYREECEGERLAAWFCDRETTPTVW